MILQTSTNNFSNWSANLNSNIITSSDQRVQLIKNLVRMMQGQLTIQEGLKENTTLTITLPSSFINSTVGTSFKKNNFLQKVDEIILENIGDDKFGIKELCLAIGLSRSQLHNKIKKQSGVSTSIYIRNIRLKKAKELLIHTDLNISEVAYHVGFNDPSYFSRNFQQTYGKSPSGFRK